MHTSLCRYAAWDQFVKKDQISSINVLYFCWTPSLHCVGYIDLQSRVSLHVIPNMERGAIDQIVALGPWIERVQGIFGNAWWPYDA